MCVIGVLLSGPDAASGRVEESRRLLVHFSIIEYRIV